MWAEAIDDAKIRVLSYDDRWHFVALLCLKAQGVLDEPNKELRQQMICTKFGMDSHELETVMKRLVTVGLVSSTGQPINWSKRQFRSDSSTSRVQAFRERSRNVSVTPQKQKQKQKQIQKQRQKEEEARIRALAVSGLNQEAFGRWERYRRETRKPLSASSIEASAKSLALYGDSQAAVVEQSIANGWRGLFPLKGNPTKAEPVRTWVPPEDDHVQN